MMKSKESRIIFVKDNWALNLGDVAIAQSMISQFKKSYPESTIVWESSHPEITKKYFDNDQKLIFVKRYFDVTKVKHTKSWKSLKFIFINLKFILTSLFQIVYIFFYTRTNITTNNETLSYYKKADIIISCGGDFLSKEYAYPLRMVEYNMAKRLGKIVVLFAQSIGPFDKFLEKYVSNTLNKLDLILARDEMSVEQLKLIGVEKNVKLTADSVILLKPSSSDKIKKEIKEKIKKGQNVGFVIRDIKYASLDNDNYLSYLDGVYDGYKILKSNQINNIFICPNPEDEKATKKFIKRYKIKNTNVILTTKFKPSEIKYFLGKLDLLITTRMHPMILATNIGTPSIAIGKEFKFKSYLKIINMEEYFINMEDFDKARFKEILNDLVKNNFLKISNKLKENISVAELRSKKNISYVKEIF